MNADEESVLNEETLPEQQRVQIWNRELFVKPIDDLFICVICTSIVQSPFDLPCGHLFCKSCFLTYFYQRTDRGGLDDEDDAQNGPLVCPKCREPLPHNLDEYKPNHTVRLMQQGWLVRCAHAAHGCTWQDTMGKLQRNIIRHKRECPFELQRCTECQMTVVRRDWKQHNETECIHRRQPCKYCTDLIPLSAHDTHYQGGCGCVNMIECPRGCNFRLIEVEVRGAGRQSKRRRTMTRAVGSGSNDDSAQTTNVSTSRTRKRKHKTRKERAENRGVTVERVQKCIIRRDQLEQHEREECLLASCSCPIQGCSHITIRRDLSQHMTEAAVKHVNCLQAQLSTLDQWKREMSCVPFESIHSLVFQDLSDLAEPLHHSFTHRGMEVKLILKVQQEDLVIDTALRWTHDHVGMPQTANCQFFLSAITTAPTTNNTAEDPTQTKRLRTRLIRVPIAPMSPAEVGVGASTSGTRIKEFTSKFLGRFQIQLFLALNSLVGIGRRSERYTHNFDETESTLTWDSVLDESDLEDEDDDDDETDDETVIEDDNRTGSVGEDDEEIAPFSIEVDEAEDDENDEDYREE